MLSAGSWSDDWRRGSTPELPIDDVARVIIKPHRSCLPITVRNPTEDVEHSFRLAARTP